MVEIELGDKVRCKYSGYTGVAVARTEFINGCVQYSITPKWDGKALAIDDMSLDENSLEVIKPIRKKTTKKETGGPMCIAFKQRGH